MLYPDYHGNSLVNLMSSILSACGGREEVYGPLAGLEPAWLSDARNIVLVVLDGVGYDYLSRQGGGSVLAQHLHRQIDAVAPPTTAASISTFLTGLAPQQHGLTGWFAWFRELGSVVTVLPFQARCNRSDLGQLGVTAEALYGHVPVFDRLQVEGYSVIPHWLEQTPFNRAHLGRAKSVPYQGLRGFYDQIATTVRAHDSRKYIYAYWPTFDSLAHDHGVSSAQAAEHFAQLDAGFTRMLAALTGTDTLVLLTADHGFVDTTPESRLSINDHPDLVRGLQLPLCGEPRLAYCYVRPAQRQAFVEYVAERIGHAVVVHEGQALIDQGLFGLGTPHPELSNRVGDFVLEMQGNYILTQRLPGEPALNLVGHHGGLSPAELQVPLIVARC